MARLKAKSRVHSGTYKKLTTFLVQAVTVATIAGTIWSQNNLLTVDDLQYINSSMSKSINGLDIMHISEINNSTLNIVSKARKEQPDIILISGGYYDTNGNYTNTHNTVTNLAQIAPTYYVYSADDMEVSTSDILADTGAMNLTNSSIKVNNYNDIDTYMTNNYGEKFYNKASTDADIQEYVEYTQMKLNETANDTVRIIGVEPCDDYDDAKGIVNSFLNESNEPLDFVLVSNSKTAESIVNTTLVDGVFTSGTYGTNYIETEYKKGYYTVNGKAFYVSGGVGKNPKIHRIFNFPQVESITMTDGSIVDINPLKSFMNTVAKHNTILESDTEYRKYHNENYRNSLNSENENSEEK